MKDLKKILNRAREGERLERDEILRLLHSKDILAMGKTATALAWKKNPDRPGIVTYIVDRNINYSNICVSRCKFCAFYREKDAEGAYVLSHEEIFKKIEETIQLGGIQILMQGGLHPELSLDFYTNLLKAIKKKFPQIHIHAFSPPEISHMAELSGLDLSTIITRLKEAGLDSIPGGGAEVLSDKVRQRISPLKCLSGQWLKVMETAHSLGLRSSATLMFGHVEQEEDIVDHLLYIRALQDRTMGFTAFIPWSFQSPHTELGGKPDEGCITYLRLVAVSRIALDNIRHVQASWVTQGPKVAQMALLFGADDMGSTMIEENVVRAAGATFRMTPEEIESVILDLGLEARRRKNDYSLQII